MSEIAGKRLAEGEVETLYVLDDWRERGVGRRLMRAAAAHLVDIGCQSAFLWVLRDNPSRWFYQRLGGRPVAEADDSDRWPKGAADGICLGSDRAVAGRLAAVFLSPGSDRAPAPSCTTDWAGGVRSRTGSWRYRRQSRRGHRRLTTRRELI